MQIVKGLYQTNIEYTTFFIDIETFILMESCERQKQHENVRKCSITCGSNRMTRRQGMSNRQIYCLGLVQGKAVHTQVRSRGRYTGRQSMVGQSIQKGKGRDVIRETGGSQRSIRTENRWDARDMEKLRRTGNEKTGTHRLYTQGD